MPSVKVFIDFWNFYMTVQRMSQLPLDIDWSQIGLRIAHQVRSTSRDQENHHCDGVYIYGSYSTADRFQASLARHMSENISLITGVFPSFETRQSKRATRTCNSCGAKIRIDPEHGVDVKIAVDVVKQSSFDPRAVMVLGTNDSDFVPLVEYLSEIGRKIIHLRDKKGNLALSKKCWANILIEDLDRAALPIKQDENILITVRNTCGYDCVRDFLRKRNIKYKTMDLSNCKDYDYELFRLFADNQKYSDCFSVSSVELESLNPLKGQGFGIQSAIQIAQAHPEKLKGPFFMTDGRILNRTALRSWYQELSEQLS